MTAAAAPPEILELLYREALCLDERRWDDWLALYTEDAEFWVPAWKGEHEPTGDPRREISLIYLTSRARLEERVARVRSGRSAAAIVLPRTAHAISNVLAGGGKDEDGLRVSSLCITHIFDPKRRSEFRTIARHELRLVRRDGAWRIRAKKAIVLNDDLPTKLEFYMI